MKRTFHASLAALTLCSSLQAVAQTLELPLLGSVEQESDCAPGPRAFNDDIMHNARGAVIASAFEECVDSDVRASYWKCIGDPWYDSPLDTQLAKAALAARSANDVRIFCTGGSGNASVTGSFIHGLIRRPPRSLSMKSCTPTRVAMETEEGSA